VAGRLAEGQGLRGPSRRAVLEQVAEQLVRRHRVRRGRITEAARFVQDPGLA
jgi:hypothetical protein